MRESRKKTANRSPKKARGLLKWAAILIGVIVLISLVFALLWAVTPYPAKQHFKRSLAAKMGPKKGQPEQKGMPAVFTRALEHSSQVAQALQKKAKGAVEPGTNVVFVVIDTQRADYLGAYGESLATSPFIDAFAKEGVLFNRMYSVAPWTVPAMNSLMTGLYPSEHGVENGGVNLVGGKRKVTGQPPLSEDAVTMAEVFQENDYSTFGINTNHHLNVKYGFSQGFDRFVGDDFLFLPYPNMMVSALADEINQSAKYFLWLHYFDPHFPYRPIPPWFGQWNTSKYHTYSEFARDLVVDYFRKDQEMGQDEPILPEYMHFLHMLLSPVTKSHAAINFALESLEADENSDFVSFLIANYKSEVRYVDTAIEEAFAQLGVDDESLVVITADHGEEMYDHGAFGHRHSLYQEMLHVPLILRLPGKKYAGKIIDVPVSTVDVMPTVLDLIGLPQPKGLSGVSLVPLLEGGSIDPRPLFSEVQNRFGKGSAIIEYPWKLIFSKKTDKIELYDLQDDPKETRDLSKENGERAQSMKKRLLTWMDNKRRVFAETKAEPLSDEEIRRLREMGYLQ